MPPLTLYQIQEDKPLRHIVNQELSIEDLYRKYAGSVYRVCLRYVRNESDAEDLVHGTFIKIQRGLSRFDQRSDLFTWIYRIAINECLQFLRKKKSDSLAMAGDIALFENTFRTTEDFDQRITVGRILRTAGEKTRMILLLIYFEGISQEEAAAMVGISRRALNKRLAHFRQSLVQMKAREKL